MQADYELETFIRSGEPPPVSSGEYKQYILGPRCDKTCTKDPAPWPDKCINKTNACSACKECYYSDWKFVQVSSEVYQHRDPKTLAQDCARRCGRAFGPAQAAVLIGTSKTQKRKCACSSDLPEYLDHFEQQYDRFPLSASDLSLYTGTTSPCNVEQFKALRVQPGEGYFYIANGGGSCRRIPKPNVGIVRNAYNEGAWETITPVDSGTTFLPKQFEWISESFKALSNLENFEIYKIKTAPSEISRRTSGCRTRCQRGHTWKLAHNFDQLYIESQQSVKLNHILPFSVYATQEDVNQTKASCFNMPDCEGFCRNPVGWTRFFSDISSIYTSGLAHPNQCFKRQPHRCAPEVTGETAWEKPKL